MPSYIICSTDKEDLGYIHGLNLCPYFPTTYATIQVQSLNTQANFQILTDNDYIEFETMVSGKMVPLCKFSLGDQQGLSYDSLPALMTTHIGRAGQLFTAMFDNLHKLVFINKKIFQIASMTYNFRVLLGYTGATFPLRSHDKTMWVNKKSSEISDTPVNNAQWVLPPGFVVDNIPDYMQCRSPDRFVNTVLPVKILPEGNWDYRIVYEADFNRGFVQFLDILPDTGTITLYKDKPADEFANKVCTVRAKIFSGQTENPFMTLEADFYSFHRYNPATGPKNTEPPVYIIGRTTLLFGQSTRMACVPYDLLSKSGTLTEIQSYIWRIVDTEIISFYGQKGDTLPDLTNSCIIQAGYKEGTTTLRLASWTWWEYDPETHQGTFKQGTATVTLEITVVNDQSPVIRQEIEPPMVGSGLSTTELYLISNCGTQSYRNSLDDGQTLMPAQVSAIISNAFSPAFPVQTSSDIIGKIPTSSLSNLWFRLVDANFVPIKLLNPLYLILSVNPTIEGMEDLTPFIGKLPKDKPTPEQAQAIAQQQEEAARQEEEQKQTSGIIQEVISGLVQQYKAQKEQEAAAQAQQAQLQQAQLQQQLQQQEALALLQGYTPEQIRQAEIAAEPPPPPPPPPTEEEIQQAVIQERKEILEMEPERIS
jgi:hypothetical protein